ncbi:hypothetical protein BDY24DRAFT_441696 [Mrakia frigida]|uniref:uncharacterized protein n=1 Tax=Mrakia frigida TaxID=29902 RepID=UPI003FCC0AFD
MDGRIPLDSRCMGLKLHVSGSSLRRQVLTSPRQPSLPSLATLPRVFDSNGTLVPKSQLLHVRSSTSYLKARVRSLASFFEKVGVRGSKRANYFNIGNGVPNTPVHAGWLFPDNDAPSTPPISSAAPTPPPKARPFLSSPSVPSATLVVPDLFPRRVNSGISGTLKTAVSTRKVVFGNTGKARDESRVDTTSLRVTLEDVRSVLVQKEPSTSEVERARGQILMLTKDDSKIETQPGQSKHISKLASSNPTPSSASSRPQNAVAGPSSSNPSSDLDLKASVPKVKLGEKQKIDELDEDRNDLVPGTYSSKAVGRSQEEDNDRLEAAVPEVLPPPPPAPAPVQPEAPISPVAPPAPVTVPAVGLEQQKDQLGLDEAAPPPPAPAPAPPVPAQAAVVRIGRNSVLEPGVDFQGTIKGCQNVLLIDPDLSLSSHPVTPPSSPSLQFRSDDLSLPFAKFQPPKTLTSFHPNLTAFESDLRSLASSLSNAHTPAQLTALLLVAIDLTSKFKTSLKLTSPMFKETGSWNSFWLVVLGKLWGGMMEAREVAVKQGIGVEDGWEELVGVEGVEEKLPGVFLLLRVLLGQYRSVEKMLKEEEEEEGEE